MKACVMPKMEKSHNAVTEVFFVEVNELKILPISCFLENWRIFLLFLGVKMHGKDFHN